MFKTVAVAQRIDLSINNYNVCWNELTKDVRNKISKKTNEAYNRVPGWSPYYPEWVINAIDVIINNRKTNCEDMDITFSRLKITESFKVCVIDGGVKNTEDKRYFSIFGVTFTERNGLDFDTFIVPGSR
ncbi:hypothetical protein DID73_01470 [Candidatus Marinamargulisbacteria bacterium SCGC AG-343-K17]|nr:hypothetical protein DID73_01470 [Candidatus Marinamargulisbacteria bacterium SCGC AG-343-K17]